MVYRGGWGTEEGGVQRRVGYRGGWDTVGTLDLMCYSHHGVSDILDRKIVDCLVLEGPLGWGLGYLIQWG